MLRSHRSIGSARVWGGPLTGVLLSVLTLAGCALAGGGGRVVDAGVIDAEPASRAQPVQRAPARPPADIIAISGPPVSRQPVAERLAEVAANVVTIIAGKNGGGGFYIDQGRHVLTTATAVGRMPQVTVLLAGGEEVTGTVILANGRRNVALVATEPVDVEGLPMMIGIPDVGMPVFAPGVVAPRSANGEPAVGVITAIRRDRGLTLIHSSIAGVSRNGGSPLLDPDGNVVGIGAAMPEAAPKTEDGSQAGSFFMPVKDALDGLGIVVERPTSPEPETPPGREVNAAPPLDLAIADGPGKTPVAGLAGARGSSEPARRR